MLEIIMVANYKFGKWINCLKRKNRCHFRKIIVNKYFTSNSSSEHVYWRLNMIYVTKNISPVTKIKFRARRLPSVPPSQYKKWIIANQLMRVIFDSLSKASSEFVAFIQTQILILRDRLGFCRVVWEVVDLG